MHVGFKIDHEKHRHLAEEFLRHPIGRHSPELQRVLTAFRSELLEGRYVLVCRKPHKEWVIGQLSGRRGTPVELLEDMVFTSLDDANREVFRLRWKKYTGHELA